MAHSLEGEVAALLDASDDHEDIEDDRCRAVGPGGDECCRDRGHREDAWDETLHVSYDSDQYHAWPVGWHSTGARIAMVLDPGFASQVSGPPEFMAGFNHCLQMVTQVLKTKGTRNH